MNNFVYRACFVSVTIVVSLLVTSAFAQPKKEALDRSREGYEFEQQGKFAEALFRYNQSIAADPQYPYPVQRIAAMYQKLRNYSKSIEFYRRAIALDSSFDDYNYYNLALIYRTLRKYDSAVAVYRVFAQRMKPILVEDSMTLRKAQTFISYSEQSQALRAQPKNTLDPVPLDTSVNSPYLDFGPAVTLDGKVLYFTSRRPSTNKQKYSETGDYGDDLFSASRDISGKWVHAMPISGVNTSEDEGAVALSADGQEIYYSLCRRPDGVGDCDLYMAARSDSGWKQLVNLGRMVNSAQWDGQPSISADGTALYFSSRRHGSIEGSEDLWVTYRNTGGAWSTPVSLGDVINTSGSERSPFIAADGKTLYFSSDGHPGYGEHDLFVTRKLDDGSWSAPVNLGAPINTEGNDEFLTIPARGDTIIYSTDRGKLGNTDLYLAQLPLELQPRPVILVVGKVFNKRTHQPVKARIELSDLDKDELLAVYQSDASTGEYRVPLPLGKVYGVTASAPNYAFYSGNFKVADTSKYHEIVYDIPLNGIDTSVTASTASDTFTLNNIFFDFGKATLRNESITELKNIAKLLKTYPTMRIEIAGHTDSVGTNEYNMKLSQDRANAVREYLVGLDGFGPRITAKGYGSTHPVAPNSTEEGRQLNRRTEFIILRKK